jgi:hypothetical protein
MLITTLIMNDPDKLDYYRVDLRKLAFYEI